MGRHDPVQIEDAPVSPVAVCAECGRKAMVNAWNVRRGDGPRVRLHPRCYRRRVTDERNLVTGAPDG